MHYFVLVITSEKDSREEAEALLDQYKETKWDWYQFGGRYTGRLDGYNPEADAKNMEKCDLCGGTGDRKDLLPMHKKACGGCNGCQGKGARVKWPTQWKERDGDIQAVSDFVLSDTTSPYAFVSRGFGWVSSEYWRNGKFVANQKYKEMLEDALHLNPDGSVFVVDCHD